MFQPASLTDTDEQYAIQNYLSPKVNVDNTDCAVVTINDCLCKFEPHAIQSLGKIFVDGILTDKSHTKPIVYRFLTPQKAIETIKIIRIVFRFQVNQTSKIGIIRVARHGRTIVNRQFVHVCHH